MFLLLPCIGLGIVVGYLRGGNLSTLAQLPFRFGWAVIVVFLVQFVIFTSLIERFAVRTDLIPLLHIVSLFALLMIVLANRKYFGLTVLGLGLLLNFMVITLNGGFMPVSAEVLAEVGLEEDIAIMRDQGNVSKGTLATEDTRLASLGDKYYINAPFVREKVFSIGDVFIGIGALIFVMQAMMPRRRRWGWS